MKNVHSVLGSVVGVLIFVFPVAGVARCGKGSVQAGTSLAVAISTPGGKPDIIPVQVSTSKPEMASVVPLQGDGGVFGLRVEPYMSGKLVAVRVSALVGPSSTLAVGPSVRAVGSLKNEPVGSYVIGSEGDSLQLADLGKLGVGPVTVKVVSGSFARQAMGDPCCPTGDGYFCCWTTYQGRLKCLPLCQ